MTTQPTPSQLLAETLEMLTPDFWQQRDWYQKSYSGRPVGACSVGAMLLSRAARDPQQHKSFRIPTSAAASYYFTIDPVFQQACNYVVRVILNRVSEVRRLDYTSCYGYGYEIIVAFNDDLGRTHEDIVEVFTQAWQQAVIDEQPETGYDPAKVLVLAISGTNPTLAALTPQLAMVAPQETKKLVPA